MVVDGLITADIALATQWNLNGNSTTSMPGGGNVTVAQLPGFILPGNITVSSVISDVTLSTGTLDGNGNFTGISSFTFGNASVGNVTVSARDGDLSRLGAGSPVTLSGMLTYASGTSSIASARLTKRVSS